MLKNAKVSSLQAIASSTLERLQKNQTIIRNPNLVVTGTLDENSQKPSMPQLSSLPEEYEERLAIAEYDGQQTPSQAERIAYLDAFVAVLVTLPHEEGQGNWLLQRITTAKEWLLDQDIAQPK